MATFRGPALSCHLPATIIPTAKKKNEAISGYPASLTVQPNCFISGARNTDQAVQNAQAQLQDQRGGNH